MAEFGAVGVATHVGRVRNENQDHSFAAPGLVVVADGMGGHEGGARASELACDVFANHRQALLDAAHDGAAITRALQAAFQEASDAVEAELRGRGGTTAVCAVATPDGGAFVAHVGDSRAYLADGKRTRQITRDHNLREMLKQRGRSAEEADAHPSGSKLTQALGFGAVSPDVARVDMGPEGRLILCSDGLTDMVDDDEFGRMLTESDPTDAATTMVGAANEAGGRDNITVAIVQSSSRERPVAARGVKHLRNQALLRGLSESDLRSVLTLMELRTFSVGEVLAQRGTPADCCYLFVRGRANVERGGATLRSVGPGDHVGELALTGPWERIATVTVTKEGAAFVLTRDSYEQLCSTRPVVALHMALVLNRRVAGWLNQSTAHLARIRRAVLGGSIHASLDANVDSITED